MDRRHMEPRPRLRQDQSGLQALLRRDIRRAIQGRRWPSLRAGFRSSPGPGKARRPHSLEHATKDLRELDGRPLSSRGPR
jgi:hypothetical protein